MYGSPIQITDACAPKGDGQCDGYGEHGDTCECVCHEASLPRQTKGVQRWHELGWSLGVLGDNYAGVRVVR